jgi:hypothetical protein
MTSHSIPAHAAVNSSSSAVAPSTANAREICVKMPFSIRNLSTMAYAMGFTQWHYKARSSRMRDIEAPGFMNDAIGMFVDGDHLAVSAAHWGAVYVVGVRDGAVKLHRMCAAIVPVPATETA